ncbi:MAG: NUDIX domain-containing protein [Candidatus Pacearchaeota archaeon]
MKYEKSCGAIVFRRDKEIKFLILYRKPGEHFRASWDFPRGNLEGSETEEEVARREIREETGITDLSFYKFRDTINFFYKFQGELIKKYITYLLAETKQKEVILSVEHQNYRWCTYDETLNTLTHKSSKETLKKAYDFLKKEEKQEKLL